MIFGITEAGDASRDYSWTEKVNDTDMSVIITKHITDEFIEKVLLFKNKVVIHATCTGYGGTVLEPNVPDYKVQLDAVKKLIKSGFPASQIVVRIDPIIPTAKGLKTLRKSCLTFITMLRDSVSVLSIITNMYSSGLLRMDCLFCSVVIFLHQTKNLLWLIMYY